jgi:hypothetical protein
MAKNGWFLLASAKSLDIMREEIAITRRDLPFRRALAQSGWQTGQGAFFMVLLKGGDRGILLY